MKIKAGDQWIIFGEAGSGKTILAHTLAGNQAFSGRIDFHGFENKIQEVALWSLNSNTGSLTCKIKVIFIISSGIMRSMPKQR